MRDLDLGFFHALEDDLERLSRYIDLTPDNFKTYSLELVRLLLAAGSEVDISLKGLCRLIDPSKQPGKITEYQPIVVGKFPDILDHAVRIERYRLELKPWANWRPDSPSWWKGYNNVKHDRTTHYKEGNLENVLNAVAGLGVIMQFLAGRQVTENFRGYFLAGLGRRL